MIDIVLPVHQVLPEMIEETYKKEDQIRIDKGAEKKKFSIKESKTTEGNDIQVNKHLKNNKNSRDKQIETKIKR